MLSEFYIAIEDFRDAMKQCVQQLADLKGINYIQMHRMSDLGWDIVGFAESMTRAHINATMWMMDATHEAETNHQPTIEPPGDILTLIQTGQHPSEEAREYWKKRMESGAKVMEHVSRRQRSRAATMEEDATRELKAAYKAYFLFIRAFHDAGYGVLLDLHGQKAGIYSSMNRCVTNAKGPIYEAIFAIPGYVDWFKSFKEKRDKIKLGVSFGLCGPQWNVGVMFNRITLENSLVVGGPENNFRLGDLITAVKHSHALVEIVNDCRSRWRPRVG